MKYYIYILKSQIASHFYIGCTTSPKERLKEHNFGQTKSTKPFRPWKIIYIESFADKNKAFKREWHLKHPKGYLEKLDIIKKHGGVA